MLNLKMSKVLVLLCLSVFFSQVSIAEVSQYSKPTEFEFNIYKYIEQRIWDLPPDRSSEDRFIQSVAQKFNLTTKKVNAIYSKITWYECQIKNRKSGYKLGEAAYMSWGEFKKWVDKIGTPK